MECISKPEKEEILCAEKPLTGAGRIVKKQA
jgi:hypothetical protein